MAAEETAHFQGEGGVVWKLDLPLSEVMAEKVTKGYLRRCNADGSPYVEHADAAPTVAPMAVTERPAQSASKAEWVGWAVHNGMEPNEAEGLTKQDLIDRFGKDA
jgi:hypothetical protein